MKRIKLNFLCLILVSVFALSMSACGTNSSETSVNASETSTQASEAASDSASAETQAPGSPGGRMGGSIVTVSNYPQSADLFEQYEYKDPETGNVIPYNLYLPENYDENKEYPLVVFIADSSVNSDTVTDPLAQDGAAVWATAEEQAKHEAIVLVPQYTETLINSIGALTEDGHQWTEGLTLVSNLIFSIVDSYSVDENRIYGTGQSQGCMATIAISDKYPDFYAAQYLVAGQWDTEEMSVMKDDNLWIVVCEGDTKAYPGMNEATAKWESLGVKVATSDMWDSTSTAEQFDSLVSNTLSQGSNINYTVFEGGNHMYTWTVAYTIEGIRDWLFSQSK
jgi:predicted peptidase